MKYWLHEEPAQEEFEDFIIQIAQALFIEKRMFENLAKVIHGTK